MEDWSVDILAALQNTKIDDKLYDSAFFNNHKKYQHVYNFIGDMIVGNLNPKSVIDWGCGCGFECDWWTFAVVKLTGLVPPSTHTRTQHHPTARPAALVPLSPAQALH